MSETETNTIDANVVPAAIETSGSSESATETTTSDALESSPAPANSKPAGYDPVDVKTASPEQVQERLDYLYRQVKPKERENREMRHLLDQQSRVIAELSEGQRAVVGHLTQQSFADNKQRLQTAMQDAWQKQDNKAYIEAQNQLMDLQVEERLSAKQQPPQRQNGQMPQSAAEVARGAMQSGEISSDEYRATETWQNEKDEHGSLIRPWAFGTDPSHQAALFEARSVLANPRFAHLSYEQKLQEIDRRMGTQKRTVSQSVIGGSLTKPAKSTKIQLSPKQREIALKSQYAGKGKSEADHLEKYRQQIEKFQSRRAK